MRGASGATGLIFLPWWIFECLARQQLMGVKMQRQNPPQKAVERGKLSASCSAVNYAKRSTNSLGLDPVSRRNMAMKADEVA